MLTDEEQAVLLLRFKPNAYGHELVLRAEFAGLCSFIPANVLFLDVILTKSLSVNY